MRLNGLMTITRMPTLPYSGKSLIVPKAPSIKKVNTIVTTGSD